DGWGVAALGQYKAEGFTELAGEVELGVAAGFRGGRFSMRANGVAGVGLIEEEKSEVDVEGKLGAGDAGGSSLSVGAEGRLRQRASGERVLTNGKTWDLCIGPYMAFEMNHLAVILEGGATNAQFHDRMGAYGLLTVAATTK